MANLKNITELPVAESADGLNLIVNDNGVAKQIAASEVGAQADWNVTDESSPAFVKNKPVIAQTDWTETDESSASFIKNKPDNILTYDKNNPPAGVDPSGVFTGGGGSGGDSPVVNVELTMEAGGDNKTYISSRSYVELCDALNAGKFLNVMQVNQAGPVVRFYYTGVQWVEGDLYLVFTNFGGNDTATRYSIGSGNMLYQLN